MSKTKTKPQTTFKLLVENTGKWILDVGVEIVSLKRH